MPLLVLNEGGSLYEWGDIGSSLVRLTTIHACLHDLTGEHSNAPTTPAAALRQLPALASLCRSAIAAACAELEAHTWREVQALAAAADEASKDWGGTGQPMLPRCGQLLVLLATAVPRWVALLESPSRLLGPLLRHAPETAPLGRLQVAQRALADAWGYGMSEAADQMALAQEVVQDEGKSGSGHLACGYLRLWRRYECAVRAQRWWTSLGAPVWACRALRSHLESVVAMPGPAPPPELLSPPLVDALQEAAAWGMDGGGGGIAGGRGGRPSPSGPGAQRRQSGVPLGGMRSAGSVSQPHTRCTSGVDVHSSRPSMVAGGGARRSRRPSTAGYGGSAVTGSGPSALLSRMALQSNSAGGAVASLRAGSNASGVVNLARAVSRAGPARLLLACAGGEGDRDARIAADALWAAMAPADSSDAAAGCSAAPAAAVAAVVSGLLSTCAAHMQKCAAALLSPDDGGPIEEGPTSGAPCSGCGGCGGGCAACLLVSSSDAASLLLSLGSRARAHRLASNTTLLLLPAAEPVLDGAVGGARGAYGAGAHAHASLFPPVNVRGAAPHQGGVTNGHAAAAAEAVEAAHLMGSSSGGRHGHGPHGAPPCLPGAGAGAAPLSRMGPGGAPAVAAAAAAAATSGPAPSPGGEHPHQQQNQQHQQEHHQQQQHHTQQQQHPHQHQSRGGAPASLAWNSDREAARARAWVAAAAAQYAADAWRRLRREGLQAQLNGTCPQPPHTIDAATVPSSGSAFAHASAAAIAAWAGAAASERHLVPCLFLQLPPRARSLLATAACALRDGQRVREVYASVRGCHGRGGVAPREGAAAAALLDAGAATPARRAGGGGSGGASMHTGAVLAGSSVSGHIGGDGDSGTAPRAGFSSLSAPPAGGDRLSPRGPLFLCSGSSGDVSGSFSGGDGGATECVLLAAAAAVPTTHPLLASLIQSVAALAGAAHSLAMHSAAGGDHHSHTAHAGADAAADAAAGPRRSPPALRAVATSLLLHLRSLQTLREGVGNDGGNGGGNGAPRAPGLAPQTLILVVELLDGVVGECQRPCVSVCLAAPVGGASSGLSREALLYAHATGSVLFAHLYDTLSAARALLLQEWRDSMPLAGMLPSALATPHLSSLYDSLDNSPRPDRARSSDASSCATRVKLVSFGDAPRSGNSATSGDASHGGSGIGERWSVAALLSSVQSMLRMPRGSRVAPLTPAGSGDSGSIRASTADGGSFARASPSGSAGTPHPRAAASAAAAATASQRLVLQLSWGQAAVLGRARALAADLRERVALLGGTLQGGFLSDASSCYATNEPQLARVWLEEGGGAAGAADGSGDSAGSSDGSAPPGACTPGTALVLDRLLRPLCALLASPHWSSPATAPHVFGLAATCVLAALEEQLQGLRRSAWRALGVDGARAALAARMNRDLGALSGAVDAFDAQQQQQEGVAGVKDPTVEQLRRHMSAMAAAWAAPSSTHDGADAAAA